jgi:tetratricopeptide (TPR) repeat protein
LFIIPFIAQSSPHPNLEDSINRIDSLQINFQEKVKIAANDSLKLIDIYYEYGEQLDNEDSIETSIEHLNIALRIATNTNNDKKIASISNYLGCMYWMTGDNKVSTQLYLNGLKSAEKAKNKSVTAKISMNLAGNYNFVGDYDNAIKYALKALEIKETENDLERICYHYMSLANIFNENNNIEKCEEYTQRAYAMKDQDGCASVSDIASIYNSMGGISEQKGNYDKALVYYDSLMILSKEANYDQGISTALTNSALIYKYTDKPQEALELSLEAKNYFGNNPYDYIFSNNNIAELYQILGQYSKALALVVENIQKEDIQYYSTERSKCLKLLYELNFSLSNYHEAYNWNDSFLVYENELRDQEVRQSLEDIETKYQTEKKEHQIELLTTENLLKKQRLNAGIGIVIILLIVILLILYISRIRKRETVFIQNDLQQQLLRSQMNPHFIFNIMGSIQNYMFQNEAKKAARYLSQFASLSRSVLEFSSKNSISLSQEIEMLNNYIALEKMRSGNHFDFILNIDQEEETDFIEIPPMMIQVFVENAIKHGLSNIDYKGLLKLNIEVKEKHVEFILEDNGSGFIEKNENQKKHNSKAMEIFRQRKKLIEHQSKVSLYFNLINLKDIDPKQSGVRVEIHLPILN